MSYELALDPSFRNLGWIVFKAGFPVHCGVIITKHTVKSAIKKKIVPKGTLEGEWHLRCVNDIASKLRNIIVTYDIKDIYSEALGGSQSARAAKLGGSTWAILATLEACLPINPITYVTEDRVKKIIGGVKHGEPLTSDEKKKKVEDRVREVFPEFGDLVKSSVKLASLHNHIYDAGGVYLACNLQEPII